MGIVLPLQEYFSRSAANSQPFKQNAHRLQCVCVCVWTLCSCPILCMCCQVQHSSRLISSKSKITYRRLTNHTEDIVCHFNVIFD